MMVWCPSVCVGGSPTYGDDHGPEQAREQRVGGGRRVVVQRRPQQHQQPIQHEVKQVRSEVDEAPHPLEGFGPAVARAREQVCVCVCVTQREQSTVTLQQPWATAREYNGARPPPTRPTHRACPAIHRSVHSAPARSALAITNST